MQRSILHADARLARSAKPRLPQNALVAKTPRATMSRQIFLPLIDCAAC